MDLAERILLTSEVERLRHEGKTFDEVLASLRERRYSKIDSVSVLASLVGLQDAKRIVHQSPAWIDVKERDEQFQQSLCEGLDELASPLPPSEKEI